MTVFDVGALDLITYVLQCPPPSHIFQFSFNIIVCLYHKIYVCVFGKINIFVIRYSTLTYFLKSNCYETLYEAANKELVNIDKWLLANRLFLNTDETHYVIFRTPKTKPPSKKLTISIRNKFISQQPKTKFLGIIFHEHLSWKLHMDLFYEKSA